jgi:photosystem II stability/assembly factor-like uncharacterized protein
MLMKTDLGMYSALLCLAGAAAAGAAEWKASTAELVNKEKPGFGGVSGVLVDHATGDLFVYLSERGLFQSKDQGKTWSRLEHGPTRGRTEQPGCLQPDPSGQSKRLVVATVYGGPIAVGALDDAAWKYLDNKSSHIDWCVVDWSDAEMKFVLALKHESGGTLLASHDGGKTFAELGKSYGPAWIFGADTAVVAEAKTKDRPRPGLLRTADGGKTFQKCGDFSVTALPKPWGKAVYWLTDGGLIRTMDTGQTWEKVSDVKDSRYGPVFGRDDKNLFLLTGAGVAESTDGGETWAQPVALPPDFKGVSPLTWLDYDPIHDVLYLMKMGSELYRLERGKQ